jgi:hypothetical protein
LKSLVESCWELNKKKSQGESTWYNKYEKEKGIGTGGVVEKVVDCREETKEYNDRGINIPLPLISKGEIKETCGHSTNIIYECVAINDKGGYCWKLFFH